MRETSTSRRYRFADFTLSPARRSLSHQGREVPLIPRYLDLLLLLVERRSEALRRQDIFDRVWSDVVVSDGALTQAVRTLRRALGEDGSDRTFIRTVSRHGYQFVCPVTEESDIGEIDRAASVVEDGGPPPSSARDPIAAPLCRLLDPASPDDIRREAAEEMHRFDTAEALRRIDRSPGHGVAWAHMRDSRWNVAGAHPVPLLGAAAGPAAWGALASLRLREALRLVGARWAAASAGGALAGVIAGLLGGIFMTGLQGPGWPPLSLLLGLALVGASIGGLGAAGVGSGLAAAEALVRSWRTPALVLLGALGGGVVGALARRGADALVEALFATPTLALGGGVEGLMMGAAAGLGYGLSTRPRTGGMASPRGAARMKTCLFTGVACALTAAMLSLAGLRLGAASLQSVTTGFPNTQVRFEAFAPLTGEKGLGPRTRASLGGAEGLLFGVGLAAGLTRRPRRRDHTP